MVLLASMSYLICVNEKCVGEIRPTRGIRPRDPPSPYLFLLVVDVLFAMISKEVENKEL